ncbi:acyltransferase [Massilia sp. R2A-15]|uniref:acyltransferase family protein n=1 Tax=Massilia sp. R2A-15 TaxID=3064278 RepID=UPI0027376233|nr:acyltransferase [Massilia sp. R2A-15]WLI88932.1 acyltransferase [Massilia sp. R2A-15]
MQKSAKKLVHLVSVRGLAAWLVVFFHSIALWRSAVPDTPTWLLAFVDHGYLAVDFFFILSGFIIFINYYEKFGANFNHNLLTFYWNRITRIYPVHLLMLGAYLVLAVAFIYSSASRSMPPGYTASAFWQSVLLVHAWTGSPLTWNVPSWSISAEWFVYLLFPFIAVFLRARIRGVGAHLLGALAMPATLAAVYFLVGARSLGASEAGMPLVRALCEFLLGALAGSLYVYHPALLLAGRKFVAVMIAIAATIVLCFDLPNYATVPALFFLVVVYLIVDTGWVMKALSARVLVYLGEISYSTYLVHYFVYDVFKAGWVHASQPVSVLALMTSFLMVLLLSMLMYKYVEIPAQDYLRGGIWKRRWGPLRFRP